MSFLKGFAQFWVDTFNYLFIGTNWHAFGYGVGVAALVLGIMLAIFAISVLLVYIDERPHKPRVFK